MRPQALWIGGAVLVLEILLGLAPRADRLTWAMENFPVWIGLVALWCTEKKFPVSSLCLAFLALHAVLLMVGGYYTYAKVPLGDWLREWCEFERNHYDRIGHFAQGFVPALLVRELLLRRAGLARNWWLPFLTVSVAWRSARFTSSSNGGRHWPPATRPMIFSARRAIPGTRNGTCASRSSGRFWQG